MLADLSHHRGDNLAQRFSLGCHYLRQEQRHQDPVALRDMMLDGDPAGLLAADQHVARGQDLFGDIFEADGNLFQRHLMAPGDHRGHVGERKRLDRPPAPALGQQMPEDQGVAAMGIYQRAGLVHAGNHQIFA